MEKRKWFLGKGTSINIKKSTLRGVVIVISTPIVLGIKYFNKIFQIRMTFVYLDQGHSPYTVQLKIHIFPSSWIVKDIERQTNTNVYLITI